MLGMVGYEPRILSYWTESTEARINELENKLSKLKNTETKD
jgi:hypothetical protein